MQRMKLSSSYKRLIATAQRTGLVTVLLPLVFLIASLYGGAAAQTPSSARQVPDRDAQSVIVRVKPSSTRAPLQNAQPAGVSATEQVMQLAASLGVTQSRPMMRLGSAANAATNREHPGLNSFIMNVPIGKSADRLVQELESQPWVEYAEIDRLVALHDQPNDHLWSLEWGLFNSGQPYWSVRGISGENNDTLIERVGVAGADLRFQSSYESSDPVADVLVGVIDTGLDTSHVDLKDRLATNPGEVPANGIDDDNNGFVDDVYGWDFSGDELRFPLEIVGDNDILDDNGHGTHVGGTIAATVNNGIGISGVCAHARVFGIKIFPNPFFSISAEAIYYAADRGARVINMSWGGSFRSRAIEDALQYAHDRGVVLVCSMGNSGRDEIFYPSGYPMTIGVGSSTATDQLSPFSTYNDRVDLVAPGQDILSLRAAGTDLYADIGEPGVHIIDEQYLIASGTSMSSPHAAGAAAVLLSFAPGLSNERVREILRASADDIVYPFGIDSLNLPGPDRLTGAGRINLGRAIEMLPGVLLDVTNPPRGTRLEGNNVTVSGRATGANFSMLRAWLLRSHLPSSDLGGGIPQNDVSVSNDVFEIRVRRADTLIGPYMLRLDAGIDAVIDWPLWFGAEAHAEIESPRTGDTIQLFGPIVGRTYAQHFESYSLSAVGPLPASDVHPILTSAQLLWDDTLAFWRTDSLANGLYDLVLTVEADVGAAADTVRVYVRDAFIPGFPIDLPAPSHFAVAAVNLDGVAGEEIVCPTQNGLYVLQSSGEIYPAWPRATDFDVTTAPAIADLDRDGKSEIVVANRSYMHVYAFIGEPFAGWPQVFLGGSGIFGNSMPVIGDVDGTGGLEVAAIDRHGRIAIWHADGTTFAPEGGEYFARIEIDRTLSSSLPRLAICDLDRDGRSEVIASADGIYVFDALTGDPLEGAGSALLAAHYSTHGLVIGDFDGDDNFELAYVAAESQSGRFSLHVIDELGTPLPGWPREIPQQVNLYLQYSLSAGDIDRDGIPELFFAPYSLGEGYLYAFHGNGAPVGSDSSNGLLAALPGTISAVTLVNIDRDDAPEIVVRVGEFISGPDRIYALKTDGQLVPGYPIRFGDGNSVTMPAPIIGDVNADGIADMTTVQSTSTSVAVWNLGIPASSHGRLWPRFSGDLWNSNVAPAPQYDLLYLVRIVDMIFGRGHSLPPFEPTDLDCDNATTIADVVSLTNYLYRNGPHPCKP